MEGFDIAEVIIELYWRQAQPFCGPTHPEGRVLRQNTGKQAAIARQVAEVQADYNGSLPLLKTNKGCWSGLVGDVARVVCDMPLWKLQRVGDEVIDFLYPNVGRGRSIRLRPGVAYCLRSFYGILRSLIEAAWINYVRSLNLDVLGQTTDLGDFLFGAERAYLEVYRPLLRDIQSDQCFYCKTPLRESGEVDHFIPWSRYPVDLGHNFVLAHRRCNGDKRDYLAAEPHLETWVGRNSQHGAALAEHCQRARVSSSLESSMSVAKWAYGQTATANGLVWVERDTLTHLDERWANLIA